MRAEDEVTFSPSVFSIQRSEGAVRSLSPVTAGREKWWLFGGVGRV